MKGDVEQVKMDDGEEVNYVSFALTQRELDVFYLILSKVGGNPDGPRSVPEKMLNLMGMGETSGFAMSDGAIMNPRGISDNLLTPLHNGGDVNKRYRKAIKGGITFCDTWEELYND